MMNAKRPVNVGFKDILSYYLPLPGIISISHRVSGILIFIGLPILVWGFVVSLSSPAGFNQVVECYSGFLMTLILWGVLSALTFHSVAGVKHLLMDWGIGENLTDANRYAKWTLGVSGVLILMLGGWLWA